LHASASPSFSDGIRPLFLGLAPADLAYRLGRRYRGDDMAASLSELDPADSGKIRRIYDLLSGAFAELKRLSDQPDDGFSLGMLVREARWDEILDLAHGLAFHPERQSPLLGSALHDIRGGSLSALLGLVQLMRLDVMQADYGRRCFSYVRDHLKIMRNCLPALDPVAVAWDTDARVHSVDLLARKWGTGKFNYDGRERKVEFVCTYRGNVSDRCMEFAALDRVIYNLTNNAARHTSDGRIGLAVFTPSENSASVRFVVSNRIAPEHAAALTVLTQGDVSVLLEGGRSTTGSGLGLRICTDFVAHAFGVRSAKEAIQAGYLGARILDGEFLGWFHWPRGSVGGVGGMAG